MNELARARRTYPQEILESLRARILRGDLEPGELLPPERELAVELGTNRNTLREALRALEALGLVEARQGQGVLVLDFRTHGELMLLADYFRFAQPQEHMRMLDDLLRLRSVVMREAVARAAHVAENGDLAQLEDRLRHLRQNVRRRGHELMEAELAVYRTVVKASKSLAGLWLFNSLEKVIRGFGHVYPDLWITVPGLLESWDAIAAAIRQRDPAGGERLIIELLTTTDAAVLALVHRLAAGPPG